MRGYVYLGGQMLAIQSSGVSWTFQDPVTKSQRVTNSAGTVTSVIDLDPWGGETWRSSNAAFQPHRYTSYERDANGGDDAMMRRHHTYWNRFDQPDPYDGSYDLGDPQSFNRYSYTQSDPVNFVDPSGLTWELCGAEFGGPACMGDGFWGGGYLGGNGWGSDPHPGRDIVTGNFLSDVRYITYTWSWYDEEKSIIYSYTLAPFAHNTLGVTPFGGNPLIGVRRTSTNPQNPQQPLRPPKQHERIVERPKDEYRACVWREWTVFNQNVARIEEAARQRFEANQIPWWLEILKNMGPPPTVDGRVKDATPTIINYGTMRKEIEEGTQKAAKARDEAIKNNCKK